MMTLGECICTLRKEKGWKQKELGKVADLSVPYISDMELDRVNLSLKVLKRVNAN